MDGISGDKTHLITVNDPVSGILFQDHINNDVNPVTFIMNHPSNAYKEGIRAGNYEIVKIGDNQSSRARFIVCHNCSWCPG
jgi:hypothetical protein